MQDNRINELLINLTLEEEASINGGKRGRGRDDDGGRRGRGKDDPPGDDHGGRRRRHGHGSDDGVGHT